MKITTLLFDLDDTVYPADNGLWSAIRYRMSLYMVERLGLPENEVPLLRRTYFETYGTTLKGLQIHHQVDPDEYLAYVHDLPLEQYLKPNPELRKLLLSLPSKRWIFTNADKFHASRVLDYIGIHDCFQGIVDIYAMKFVCKPDDKAFYEALRLVGESDPGRCIVFDDTLRNIAAAYGLGFITVLVSRNSKSLAEGENIATYTLSSLLEMPEKIPVLWDHQTSHLT